MSSINITAPAQGDTVKGIVPVTVAATGVSKVNFYVDGVLKGRDQSAPFKFSWYTTNYPDGTHTVKAVANGGRPSASVTVTVANAVPAPTPPTGWPSSYLTGPLGVNNVLPSQPGAPFLALQCGGIGVDAAQSRTRFDALAAAFGFPVNGYHYQYAGGDSWGGVYGCTDPAAMSVNGVTQEQFAISRGAIPILAWTPQMSLASINAGTADAITDKLADDLLGYGPNRVMLRLFSEWNLRSSSNGGVTPIGSVPSGSLQAAWRRIVDRFRARAAALGKPLNVGFIWNVDEGNNRDWVNSEYPGPEYVDWCSSDNYNRSMPGDATYSSPLHSGWALFGDIFNYTRNGGLPTSQAGRLTWSMYDIFSSGRATAATLVSVGASPAPGLPAQKPFMVGETGTVYAPSFKAAWFPDLATNQAALLGMPGVVCVSFYDADVTAAEGPNSNFLVDYPTTDPAVLAGFEQMGKAWPK